jgi:hypothetical protein
VAGEKGGPPRGFSIFDGGRFLVDRAGPPSNPQPSLRAAAHLGFVIVAMRGVFVDPSPKTL